ncbi:hypothetical protein PP175_28880 (plasmid) [Aneurinibacillus sp. Ricciae_BoGa-3]|uniref:hypothetical protein n=1 Tax=Aneurinibacillus sp. Ricciae_BoGa-3 TaxID=3022697 RepID=UPI0023414E13|nr:hypothetical protein [Aneurinibacillus sp. Ricciae_BoGa-3]WCK57206.1 hypothetical protein PP175_28880 [Aneurinibacillus sp. Ricciae_BoGa-3]
MIATQFVLRQDEDIKIEHLEKKPIRLFKTLIRKGQLRTSISSLKPEDIDELLEWMKVSLQDRRATKYELTIDIGGGMHEVFTFKKIDLLNLRESLTLIKRYIRAMDRLEEFPFDKQIKDEVEQLRDIMKERDMYRRW